MTDTHHVPPAGIARRDFMIAGGGAAVLAAGLAGVGTALAQVGSEVGSPPAAAPGTAKPGNIRAERRGSVLLIGIDRPEAQNRFDAPMLIGLGKAYHWLDHEDELRAAVLYGVGRDFSLGIDRGLRCRASLGPAPAKGSGLYQPGRSQTALSREAGRDRRAWRHQIPRARAFSCFGYPGRSKRHLLQSRRSRARSLSRRWRHGSLRA